MDPVLALIAGIKDANHPFAINVHADGYPIGRLRPIDHIMAARPELHELLCEWRSRNMQFFLTRFDPSPVKTRQFLVEFSLPDPRRVLFLIETYDGRPIGHMGFCNVTEAEAEFDNVVRGVEVPERRFIEHAARALLAWAFETLRVRRVVLSVLVGNDRAKDLYRRLGFQISKVVTLRREETSSATVLKPASSDQANTDERLLYMQLQRSDFLGIAP